MLLLLSISTPHRFDVIQATLIPKLKELGYREVTFIPVSALGAVNLRGGGRGESPPQVLATPPPAPPPPPPPPPPELAGWYEGPALLDAIDSLESAPRGVAGGVEGRGGTLHVGSRLCIHDAYHSVGGASVTGLVQAGSFCAGDHLVLVPSSQPLQLKAITSRGCPVTYATAG